MKNEGLGVVLLLLFPTQSLCVAGCGGHYLDAKRSAANNVTRPLDKTARKSSSLPRGAMLRPRKLNNSSFKDCGISVPTEVCLS